MWRSADELRSLLARRWMRRMRLAFVGRKTRERIVFALVGQPNSGKSTLFNGLTGSHQHVGNWPGKTVEQKVGEFELSGKKNQVVDLPGAYSLTANSPEEEVTHDFLISGDVDAALVVVDASQLERSLFILADFAACAPQTPCVLVLNLMDIAEQQGKRIDAKKLESRLGVPVVPFGRRRCEALRRSSRCHGACGFREDSYRYRFAQPRVCDAR